VSFEFECLTLARADEFREIAVSAHISKRDRAIAKPKDCRWLFIAFNYGHVIYLSSVGNNSFAPRMRAFAECFRSSLCTGRAQSPHFSLSLSLSRALCPHIKFANKFAMTVLYRADAAVSS